MNNTQTGGLKEHPVTLRAAVMMMYCLVAAGAFGIEEMIPDAGPGMTIVVLCVLPFIWAAPQALCAAELGSAITDAGGFYKWIQRGMGEFWAFQGCWCRTLSCYVDNTTYVVLAGSYTSMLIPMSSTAKFIFMAVLIAIFTVINLLGIEEVGKVSTIFSTVIFIVFVGVTIIGFVNWDHNPLEPFYNSGDYTLIGALGSCLATGMWMYSGYTSMSTLATECQDKTVIPRGLMIVMPIIALSYILPTIAGLGSVGNWSEWGTEGISFGHVLALAGAWGLPVFTVAAVCSQLSIFNTQIISVSRGFFGMSIDNLAPKALMKLSKKRKVPYVGVLSLSVVALCLCNLDFSVLITIDVTLLMVDYVLVFLSTARLRKTEPNMPRPFKIPGGDTFVKVLVAPGVIISVVALFLNGADYFLGGMIGLMSAPILYIIWKRMYGGLYKIDPVKYPINPRTKLAIGDLHRVVVILVIFGVIGFIGATWWFGFYEVGWEADYLDTYGKLKFMGDTGEEIVNWLYTTTKWLSVLYLAAAVVIKIAAVKIDPRSKEIPDQDMKEEKNEL
ncbi:APC family permease [Anaerovorax odorimutans]|uniref:APC family permease n=1 Tax=Anaerovorax odorimutans TaxID=109327 RepID=A0ABT1RMN6_9FIRM|nr:APC family permease [Anaerovorax odorimutans]MCQ4636448.1 APC family permease [Anaerovorax odorimutans]